MYKESLFMNKWRTAKIMTGAVASVVISIISMAVFMTVSFLGMLFESGDDGRRTCFFDTMYFESVTKDDGAISMGFGFTGDTFPIVFWFVAVFLFCFLSFYFAKKILMYRQNLIDEMNKANT